MVAGAGVLPGVGGLAGVGQVKVPGSAALSGVGTIAPANSTIIRTGAVVMGGFGEVRAYPLHPETFYVNGLDAWTCVAFMTPDLSGLGSAPAKRTQNVTVPGRHGAVRTPNKRYDVNTFPMTVWVKGVNSDGTRPDDPDVAYYTNLDRLYRMFSEVIELEHVLPDSSSRVITVEVLDQVDYTRKAGVQVGSVGLTMTATDPFWRGKAPVSASISSDGTPTIVPLTAFAESTAPIEDAIVVFTGPLNNPSMRCGDYFLMYEETLAAGQTVTVDVGNWSISSSQLTVAYSKLVHAGIGTWFSLVPREGGPVVEFDHTGVGTGSVAITARNAYLGG